MDRRLAGRAKQRLSRRTKTMSKASKFQMVDPAMGDDVYQHMAAEVNDRMGKAVDDLARRHEEGKVSKDTSVDGPSGDAYRAIAEAEAAERRAAKRQAQLERDALKAEAREAEIIGKLARQELNDEEGDEDEDAEVKRIRERRLQQLKAAHQEKVENISKGHGQYREITQDEFLPEVTSSKKVICHFYHNDFQRCKIMDKHLAALAPKHVECKFLRIDANKAPFFVEKLKVRVLPTLVLFTDGVALDHVQGFEAFTQGLPEGKQDEFPTNRLAGYLGRCQMIDYHEPAPVDQDALAKMRSSIIAGLTSYDEDFDDLSD